jgi:hypothetical protein
VTVIESFGCALFSVIRYRPAATTSPEWYKALRAGTDRVFIWRGIIRVG